MKCVLHLLIIGPWPFWYKSLIQAEAILFFMQLLHGACIIASQCLDLIVLLGETFCIACFANGKAIKDEP